MNIEQRMKIERQVVRHLIRTAKKHGFALVAVNNGEERIKVKTETEAMDHVFSVDESRIIFRHPTHTVNHVAQIVLGNDGWDAIADWSEGPLWEDVMKECEAYSDMLCM